MSFSLVLLSVLKVMGVAVLSWVMIHVLAMFGAFLAVAYPVLWIVNRKMVPAIINIGKQNKVDTFGEALKNAGVLLGISVVSMGLVFGESKLLFKMGLPTVKKTAYFAIPSRDQYAINEVIPLEIKVAGISTAINAVQADIAFDPQMLEVVDFDNSDSFANIFVQREIDNNAGFSRVNGGLPSPGFTGMDGKFATVYFRAKAAGVTKVEFLPTSLILANDGYGTNVLKSYSATSYFILPEEASSKAQSVPTLTTSVLGEDSQSGEKLEFFDENEGVLGVSTQEDLDSVEVSQGQYLLDKLREYNQWVMEFWFGWME